MLGSELYRNRMPAVWSPQIIKARMENKKSSRRCHRGKTTSHEEFSNHCRKSTDRQYLGPDLSISKMFCLYVEECKEAESAPAKRDVCAEIFHNDFKLACHISKKRSL
ncbi:hypothetical protein PoB_001870900 [Plakobranchus ocellatus]|uniref:Uncharacterized protein n=1 Tax=Plakobranchus ocellatus TaxID=259542 RepID=A0AAV3ZA51_9GAST|nr:hypothetical protein PoB_001870900 [Plakobranchus ocellatus]